MLKSLQISNFQSHKLTAIELSPSVTAIIGLNNHGKSSVLRAFQKVIRNEPSGTTFISDGTTQCELTLVTDGGKICRSVKNNLVSDANKYTINDTDDFVKFDTEIPAEVLALLDISPIQQFGDIEVDFNFQSQLDSLFLVQGDGLPSKRGKILGSVTGVDIVNRAIQLCSTEMKSSKSSIARTELDVAEVDNKLLVYKDLDDISNQVENLHIDVKQCEKFSTQIESYQKILSSLETLVEQGSKATEIVNAIDLTNLEQVVTKTLLLQKHIQICKQLLSLQRQISTFQLVINISIPEDVSSINELIKQIRLAKSLFDIQRKLNNSNVIAIQTQDIGLVELEKEKVVQTQVNLQTYSNLRSLLRSLQIKIQTNREAIASKAVELQEAEDEKIAFEKELGICPTCGKAFKPPIEQLSYIKKVYD